MVGYFGGPMKGRYISSQNSSRSFFSVPQLQGFISMGFPQQTQWTNAPRKPRILFQSGPPSFLRGYMAIYVGFSGGVYTSTSTSTVESWKIPGYQHPHLQWTTSRCLLISCLWCCRRWLSSLPCGLGWPTALIAGWAGSRLKIKKKILLLERKYSRFNWNISYCRGAAKSILERIPIIGNVPQLYRSHPQDVQSLSEIFTWNGSPFPAPIPSTHIHPPQINQQQKFEHKWPNRQWKAWRAGIFREKLHGTLLFTRFFVGWNPMPYSLFGCLLTHLISRQLSQLQNCSILTSDY